MINKIINSIIFSSLLFPFFAKAAELKNPLAGVKLADGREINSLPRFIEFIMSIFVGFMAIMGIIAITLAGYQMIYGSGDPEKITQAKSRIAWSIGGMITVIFAWSIVRTVLSLFTQR